jgi:hypothetical protein
MDDHPTNGAAREAVGMRNIILGDDEANKQVEYCSRTDENNYSLASLISLTYFFLFIRSNAYLMYCTCIDAFAVLESSGPGVQSGLEYPHQPRQPGEPTGPSHGGNLSLQHSNMSDP